MLPVPVYTHIVSLWHAIASKLYWKCESKYTQSTSYVITIWLLTIAPFIGAAHNVNATKMRCDTLNEARENGEKKQNRNRFDDTMNYSLIMMDYKPSIAFIITSFWLFINDGWSFRRVIRLRLNGKDKCRRPHEQTMSRCLTAVTLTPTNDSFHFSFGWSWWLEPRIIYKIRAKGEWTAENM